MTDAPITRLDRLAPEQRRGLLRLVDDGNRRYLDAPWLTDPFDEPGHGFHVIARAGTDEEIAGWAYARPSTVPGEWDVDVITDAGLSTAEQVAIVCQLATEATRPSNDHAHDHDHDHDQPRVFRLWAHEDAGAPPTVATAADQLGAQPFRVVRQMRRTLTDADVVPSLERDMHLRPFTVDDAAAVTAIDASAFATHPERRHRTQDRLWHDLHQLGDRFDDLLLLVNGDGPPVGFCWVKPRGQDDGEIFVLAVDPDAPNRGRAASRGHSYGRVLLHAGLARLRQHYGFHHVVLYVEHDNDRAVRLYESERFTFVDDRHRAWTLPAPDQPTTTPTP